MRIITREFGPYGNTSFNKLDIWKLLISDPSCHVNTIQERNDVYVHGATANRVVQSV